MCYWQWVLQKVKQKIIIPIIMMISRLSRINPNKIVVDNFGGRGYGDNPKYIIDELLKDSQRELDIVWLVNNMNEPVPNGVRKVKYNSVQSIYEYSTARIWIDNIKNSVKPRKKRGQYYVQTWHGGIGLKAVEKQIEKELDPRYVRLAKRDAKQTDLMLSDSKWTTEIFSNWFWYDGRIAEVGFPRNDVLVKKPQSVIKKVYDHFSLQENQKIVLYAPTFRDDGDVSPYIFDYNKIIDLLNWKFGNEYVFLLRLHPNIKLDSKSYIAQSIDDTKVFNANSYNDVQELLLTADVIITDFSSLMFDAMIADKKVFLFAKDFDQYIATQRRLLLNVEQLPFPLSKSISTLHQQIETFDSKKYFTNLNSFRDELGLQEFGNAAEKVKDIIVTEIQKG